MPFVYILSCADGTLYTGAARNLDRRLAQHHAGKAAKYTRGRRPVELVWTREVETWGQTLREERRIKKLRRTAKTALTIEKTD